jgi:predicted O-methyltransferase YrrM
VKEFHLIQRPAVSSIRTEDDLVSACMALIGSGATLTSAERERVRSTQSFLDFFVDELQQEIRSGNDPLGLALSRIRSEEQRRGLGAVYTPEDIVESMLKWAQSYKPERVVDPGTGSGHFTIGAARYFPHSELIAVEIDPLAALVLRANLAVHCLSHPLPSDRGRLP